LESRGFDPILLEREWNLLGTGPYSKLDHIDYKHRIIIPFFWDTQQVSFDSRDITGKDAGRYKACPKDRELIPHKEILYGKQSEWKETGICVEGPTDVWRFGTCSFATSGIKYTPKQIRQMAKAFKRIAVVFDDDSQATVQAGKLVAELKFRGVDSFKIAIKGDPGSMSQEEANYLVKQLI
jgi:DNA primase